jgi:muramoyltetrapeptide carboxypeptidase
MATRRTFLTSSLAAAAALIPLPSRAKDGGDSVLLPKPTPAAFPELLRPKALKRGATIGIVAPASGLLPSDLKQSVKTLKDMGFVVVLGKNLYRRDGYLSADDEARADEFMEFARRDDIDCLMCARGGYGTMRILPMLDYDVIHKHPKIIIGYSDITALLNAITEKSRLVTFHGPVADSKFTPFTTKYFWELLGASRTVDVKDFPPYERATALEVHAPDQLVKLTGGNASGLLVGGNLSMVVSLLGTPYEINTKGKIFFLEEITEEPYRIDRMLTQLWLAGKLQECSAIALGRFKDCEVRGNSPFRDLSLRLKDVLKVRIASLNIPAVYGLPFGHVKDKLTVPVGVRATLDADNLKFQIDEPAVS